MKKIELNAYSIIGGFGVLLMLICICEGGIARTDPPLKCHVCDVDTCKSWTKKAHPKECTQDDLNVDNIGPSKLSNFTYIPFSPIGLTLGSSPPFHCMKIEVYNSRSREMNTLRKCQYKLPGNESCQQFKSKAYADPERTYSNISCYLCDDWNGCNSSGLIYIWAPLLLFSIVLCVFIK